MIILLPWALLNMGTEQAAPITAPGLEYTVPESRLHYTLATDRAHFTFDDEDQ